LTKRCQLASVVRLTIGGERQIADSKECRDEKSSRKGGKNGRERRLDGIVIQEQATMVHQPPEAVSFLLECQRW
jgi:hypothetical protein